MAKRGTGGASAELMFEKWLILQGIEHYHRARKSFTRTGANKFITVSNDILGCIDFMVLRPDEVWMVQITTQAGRTARKRKIEKIDWPSRDVVRVSLINHEKVPDPAHRGRSLNFWKYQDYKEDGTWSKPEVEQFDKKKVDAIKTRKKKK